MDGHVEIFSHHSKISMYKAALNSKESIINKLINYCFFVAKLACNFVNR